MRHLLILVHILLYAGGAIAQASYQEQEISLTHGQDTLFGTLTLPSSYDRQTPISLIIAGSGPTDRDGNNPIMTNNSLQMLARKLAENNIASLRFDKRGIGKSSAAMVSEEELRFETYVQDASLWIDKIDSDYELGALSIIGHSEGSLIGMLAAQQVTVSKFISLAGPAQSGDKIIREQLKDQHASIKNPSYQILDSLSQGYTVSNVPTMLYSLFRPSVQPYLISWFAYVPQHEISKLSIPTLIMQGTTDFQISVAEAQVLAKASPQSQLIIVEGMNHILKIAPEERTQNALTYNQPNLPLAEEAVKGMVNFIKN